MSPRTLFIGTMLAILPLAGCLGGGEEPAGTAQTDDDGGDNDTFVAPTGRGPIVAFEETNKTEEGAGGVDHHHDHWQGRDRITVFETTAAMEPFPDDQNRAFATFRPPPQTFIYEGTASVDFTITNPRRHACEGLVTFGGHYYCTDYVGGLPAAPPVPDPAPPAGLKLRYKHAATVEWIDAGDIAWDTPLSIKITNPVQTDMPHATSSVWEFQVISPNPHDTTLLFDAKADIVRAEGEIPLWPGHPLFYDENRTKRVAIDNVQAAACDGRSGCALAGGDTDPVRAEKIISYGTRTLYVWINVSDLQTPNPVLAPSAWFLYHNNATGRTNITNPFDFENYGIEKRELFWALPVDDNGMDSPYADGSRWNFQLGASYTTPDNPTGEQRSCYGGCAEWSAEYTLHVVASSDVLPAEQYHLYCLDPMSYCGEEEEESGREAYRARP